MKYVLDSSVALKWLLPEPDSDKAIQLREDARNGVHELLAPDIFPTEILNSLTKAERTRRLNVGEGYPLWQSILTDLPALFPHAPLLDRAYQIAGAGPRRHLRLPVRRPRRTREVRDRHGRRPAREEPPGRLSLRPGPIVVLTPWEACTSRVRLLGDRLAGLLGPASPRRRPRGRDCSGRSGKPVTCQVAADRPRRGQQPGEKGRISNNTD